MTVQLDVWRGEFGAAYTERNPMNPGVRLAPFRTMLGGLGISSALEVGCNRGHNLATLAETLGKGSRIVGVEPNAHARSLAEAIAPGQVVEGSADRLPFADASFDAVLTCGVLIHVPPEAYEQSLREIRRVARRYVLAAEYYAAGETAIEYRGHNDLLWKRDFASDYIRVCGDLEVVRSGYWTKEDGFDRSHWWLLAVAG